MINSILDNDSYKFSMQQYVLELYPEVTAEYRFKNRGEHKFNSKFLKYLKQEIINNFSHLSLSDEEYLWLKNNIPYLKPQYIEYLKNYRFNTDQVNIDLDKNNNLQLSIKGLWRDTILWEVPLMALISELYFKIIDVNWNHNNQKEKAFEKIKKLSENKCLFADFGTRRRRSLKTQHMVLQIFINYKLKYPSTFIGTSNVYFAKKYNLKPIGTMAHEIIQASQALETIRHCNYYTMDNWIKVFNTDLGIALTDTITTNQFLKNFNTKFAKLFDGVRQDSGDPFIYTDKIINHYEKIGINPLTKFIIFSDSLNTEKCIQIKKYCKGKINCSFGIGTDLTNSYKNSSALNMVIKLHSINNIPVVKISDDKGKEMGDPKAIEITKWIIENS
jgi:nicotinate phosphoribosyltransferase